MSEDDLSVRLSRRLAMHIPARPARLDLPRGALSITFDDFPRSAWREGGPVLGAHGVRGTYYFCGGMAHTTYRGLEHFHADDLAAIHSAGHEIGCHTFEHCSALRTSGAELERSLERNRAFAAAVLPGLGLRTFAYPFGEAGIGAKMRLRRRFEACRGAPSAANAPLVDLMLLRSMAIGAGQGEAVFADAARRKRWLIMVTHDVSDRPSEYGCRPRELERVIEQAKGAGLMIGPVAEVLHAAKLGRDRKPAMAEQAGAIENAELN